MRTKIAIFASGSGTNAENIARYFADSELAQVTLVFTNVRDAGVVKKMRQLGIDTYYIPNSEWHANPERIADFMVGEGIGLVVLAGFMRKVDDKIVERFRNRMLNIHPSLLPAYGGKGMYGHHVHEAVIAAGEKQSGVTVHQVSEVMDGGEIVAQQSVEITADETPETLESKIHQVEYALYPQAIEKVLLAANSSEPSEPVAGMNADSVAEQNDLEAEAEATLTEAEADASGTPPATVAAQWADALGVEYNEEDTNRSDIESQTPPPMPDVPPTLYPEQPPALHSQPPCAPAPASISETEPAADQTQQEEFPPTYLLWSILCLIFCCTIAGVVATVFSCQVSSRYYNGDYEGARKASSRAQLWIIISFCLGILQATIFTPLYLLSTL